MCCKSKFVITEEDKSHILKLYGLLNEQEVENEPTSNQSKTFTIQPKLPAGIWSENPIKQNLSEFFSDLSTFLSSSSGKTYITTIDLVGSESKIPNTDNESSNHEPLEEGQLSIRRLKSIKKIIGDTFKKYREDGTLINDPSYNEKTLIGDTEWLGQTFGDYKCEESELRKRCKVEFNKCKDTTCKSIADKYKSEQYVKVTVNFVEVPAKCLYNAKIVIYTLGQNGDNHRCNNAKYAVYLNDVLLKNDLQVRPYLGDGPINGTTNYASMDNLGGKHDFDKSKPEGARYNYFTITPEMATEILLKGKNKNELVLSLACLKGIEAPHKGSGKDCHADAVHYKYIPGEGTQGEPIKGETTGITDDQVKKNVATIKVCGG